MKITIIGYPENYDPEKNESGGSYYHTMNADLSEKRVWFGESSIFDFCPIFDMYCNCDRCSDFEANGGKCLGWGDRPYEDFEKELREWIERWHLVKFEVHITTPDMEDGYIRLDDIRTLYVKKEED